MIATLFLIVTTNFSTIDILAGTECHMVYSCSATNVLKRTNGVGEWQMGDRYSQLMALLRSVNKGIFELADEASREFGLGLTAKITMGRLCDQPGCTISQLARQLGLAKSHVSTTVEQLVAAGLVEKRSDSCDHRLVRIFPTSRSMAHFTAIDQQVERHLHAALSAIPAEQIDAMIAGLEALRATLSVRRSSDE